MKPWVQMSIEEKLTWLQRELHDIVSQESCCALDSDKTALSLSDQGRSCILAVSQRH
jgi:hypothetical protein